MVYSGAWGKLIHEKNQKQKISWHCPFKGWLVFALVSMYLLQKASCSPNKTLLKAKNSTVDGTSSLLWRRPRSNHPNNSTPRGCSSPTDTICGLWLLYILYFVYFEICGKSGWWLAFLCGRAPGWTCRIRPWCCSGRSSYKGTVSWDFLLLVFFH